MQTLFLGVPMARWLVAAAGLGFFAIGLSGAFSGGDFGHCLKSAAATAGHCGWCYAALAAFVIAALPWPARIEAKVR